MKKINLVFAGQSNMMGACVFPPKVKIVTTDSYEYTLRFGFRSAGYPCGEFLYIDKDMSDDTNVYKDSTFFCPAMYSYKGEGEEYPFATWSQNNFPAGVSLAPIVAMVLEKEGIAVNYAHVAKGSVSINHFLKDDTLACLAKKVRGLFDGSQAELGNYLVWLQGESDASKYDAEGYCDALSQLWRRVKPLGFDGFLCVRVGYFGNDSIVDIMRGQELFCQRNRDAHMMTRANSFMPYAGRDESGWFVTPPAEKYQNCRDSFYGYRNQHVNEKGFFTIADAFAQNLVRLTEGKEPIPEPENLTALTEVDGSIII